jgi:hypothetical protein
MFFHEISWARRGLLLIYVMRPLSVSFTHHLAQPVSAIEQHGRRPLNGRKSASPDRKSAFHGYWHRYCFSRLVAFVRRLGGRKPSRPPQTIYLEAHHETHQDGSDSTVAGFRYPRKRQGRMGWRGIHLQCRRLGWNWGGARGIIAPQVGVADGGRAHTPLPRRRLSRPTVRKQVGAGIALPPRRTRTALGAGADLMQVLSRTTGGGGVMVLLVWPLLRRRLCQYVGFGLGQRSGDGLCQCFGQLVAQVHCPHRLLGQLGRSQR